MKVRACGVCRTDLHVVDGELPHARVPLVPGHEIVGVIDRVGAGVSDLAVGDRVGIPWLGYSCGACEMCRSGRENLCPNARFTGYQIDGGYADYAVADARFVFAIPERYADVEAAPLLCAGLIGYRAYRMAGDARRLGLYGFGAAAHIIAQVAVHDGREVFALTSPGDAAAQEFARSLGAAWAGASTEAPPEPLDAAIIFAPVGRLIPEALSRVAPGGRGGVRGDPHERYPVVSVPFALGGARDPFGRQPDAPGRSGVSVPRRADADSHAHRAVRSGRTPTVRWPICARGRFKGAAVLVPAS